MKVITIGRSVENDVVLNDMSVSRFNTQIVLSDKGEYSVIDLGSANGTYVNGCRISGECPLKPGDVVRVANVQIDWQSLVGNGGHLPAKGRNSWVLSLILGIVSLALIVGVVIVIIMFSSRKKSDMQKIAALEESQMKYENERKDSEDELDFSNLKTEAYMKELKSNKDASEKALSAEKKNTEDAQKAALEVERKLKDTEKKNKELQAEFEKAKDKLVQEAKKKDVELSDLQAIQDSLETLLKSEKEKYAQELERQKKTIEDMTEFLSLLNKLSDEDVYKICDQLRCDYTNKSPRTALLEKYKTGESSELIITIMKRRIAELSANK